MALLAASAHGAAEAEVEEDYFCLIQAYVEPYPWYNAPRWGPHLGGGMAGYGARPSRYMSGYGGQQGAVMAGYGGQQGMWNSNSRTVAGPYMGASQQPLKP